MLIILSTSFLHSSRKQKSIKKEQAWLATWSNLSELESDLEYLEDDNEEVDVCLIAILEKNVDTWDELFHDDVYSEMKNLLKALKKADMMISKIDTKIKVPKNEKDTIS